MGGRSTIFSFLFLLRFLFFFLLFHGLLPLCEVRHPHLILYSSVTKRQLLAGSLNSNLESLPQCRSNCLTCGPFGRLWYQCTLDGMGRRVLTLSVCIVVVGCHVLPHLFGNMCAFSGFFSAWSVKIVLDDA